jgi:hypothetical protein
VAGFPFNAGLNAEASEIRFDVRLSLAFSQQERAAAFQAKRLWKFGKSGPV